MGTIEVQDQINRYLEETQKYLDEAEKLELDFETAKALAIAAHERAKEEQKWNLEFYSKEVVPEALEHTKTTLDFINEFITKETEKQLDTYVPGWKEAIIKSVEWQNKSIQRIEDYLTSEYPQLKQQSKGILEQIAANMIAYKNQEAPKDIAARVAARIAVSNIASDTALFNDLYRDSDVNRTVGLGLMQAYSAQVGAYANRAISGISLRQYPIQAMAAQRQFASMFMPQLIDPVSLFGTHLQSLTGNVLYNPIESMNIYAQAGNAMRDVAAQSAGTYAALAYERFSTAQQAQADIYAAQKMLDAAKESSKIFGLF